MRAPVGRDGYTGLVILVASLALFWATLDLERHPMVPVGPGFYPRIVLGVSAVLAALLVVVDLVARRRPGVAGGRAAPSPPGGENRALVVASFGVFAAYVVLLPYLGFRIATMAFLVGMQVLLEPPKSLRRWVVVGVIALVASIATYYVFERYLHVLLPRGRWTDF